MLELDNPIPQKPPLGVMPEQIWLEKRAHELARAIQEHLTSGHHQPVTAWIDELQRTWTRVQAGTPLRVAEPPYITKVAMQQADGLVKRANDILAEANADYLYEKRSH